MWKLARLDGGFAWCEGREHVAHSRFIFGRGGLRGKVGGEERGN